MSAVVKTPHHLDMDGHRIGSVGDPEADQDVATRGYVDRKIAAAIADYEACQKQDATTQAAVVRPSAKNV